MAATKPVPTVDELNRQNGRFTLDKANDALAAVENRTAIKAVITPNPTLV